MAPAVLRGLALACVLQLRFCSGAASTDDSDVCIDVVDLQQPHAASRLDASFRASGFAVITGHGVPREVLSEFRQKGLEFFRQPLEAKQRYNSGKGYGFGGYLKGDENVAQLLGDFTKPEDWVESLTFPGGLPRLSNDSSMPELHPHFQRAADEAFASIAVLRSRLESLICEALGGDPEDLMRSVDSSHPGGRLGYYPPQSVAPKPGQLRYGAHVDSGGISILVRDAVAPWGTQVQLDDDSWVDVPLVDDSIVINVGALLSRVTNGRWRASVHRVANAAEERLSIIGRAMVFKFDAQVTPLDSCVSSDSPSRYEPVVVGDFLRERARLHRDSYSKEQGYPSKAQAEEVLGEKIREYQI